MAKRPASTRRIDDGGPTIRTVPFGAWPLSGETQLHPRDREAIRTLSTRMRLPAGTLIVEQDRPARWIFNVVDGCAFAERRRSNGARTGLALVLPGDLCGLARQGVYVNDVRTLVQTHVLRIPLEPLRALLMQQGTLQLLLLAKVTQALRQSQRHLMLLARKDPFERVTALLATLAHAMPRPAEGMAVPLSQQDLASYLNLAPSSVSRAVSRLEEAGVLRRVGRKGFAIASRPLQRLVHEQPHLADEERPGVAHEPPDRPRRSGTQSPARGGHDTPPPARQRVRRRAARGGGGVSARSRRSPGD